MECGCCVVATISFVFLMCSVVMELVVEGLFFAEVGELIGVKCELEFAGQFADQWCFEFVVWLGGVCGLVFEFEGISIHFVCPIGWHSLEWFVGWVAW